MRGAARIRVVPEARISLGGSMEMFYAGKGGYPRG